MIKKITKNVQTAATKDSNGFFSILTAIAIAISDSVTVSIGEDTRGALRLIFLVIAELRSTSSAVKSMKPGKMMKSLHTHTGRDEISDAGNII